MKSATGVSLASAAATLGGMTAFMNELLELAQFPFCVRLATVADCCFVFHVRLVPMSACIGWQDVIPELLAFCWREFELLRPAGVRATYGISGEPLDDL